MCVWGWVCVCVRGRVCTCLGVCVKQFNQSAMTLICYKGMKTIISIMHFVMKRIVTLTTKHWSTIIIILLNYEHTYCVHCTCTVHYMLWCYLLNYLHCVYLGNEPLSKTCSADVQIPCEFCNQQFKKSLIYSHQVCTSLKCLGTTINAMFCMCGKLTISFLFLLSTCVQICVCVCCVCVCTCVCVNM